MLGFTFGFILLVREVRRDFFEKVIFELWFEGWVGLFSKEGKEKYLR